MVEFKVAGHPRSDRYASAILMDPEYGLDAIKERAPGTGVLLAYEKTGYDADKPGRLPDLLPEWSVRRLAAAGANAIKILLYYNPEDTAEINTIKHAFIERIGAECAANDMPFFLEPICYSDEIGDEKSLEFAKAKPRLVTAYMAEFSKPQYGVDVLKVEVPVNVKYVEGSAAFDGTAAYTDGRSTRLLQGSRRRHRVCPSSICRQVLPTKSSVRHWNWLGKLKPDSLACSAVVRPGRMASRSTARAVRTRLKPGCLTGACRISRRSTKCCGAVPSRGTNSMVGWTTSKLSMVQVSPLTVGTFDASN